MNLIPSSDPKLNPTLSHSVIIGQKERGDSSDAQTQRNDECQTPLSSQAFLGSLPSKARPYANLNDPSKLQTAKDFGNHLRIQALEALVQNGLTDVDPWGYDHNRDPHLSSMATQILNHVEVMRKDFAYDHSDQIEQIIIEEILTAWVQSFVSTLIADRVFASNLSERQNVYLEKRSLRCRNRLARAIEQLARIRNLSSRHLLRQKPGPKPKSK